MAHINGSGVAMRNFDRDKGGVVVSTASMAGFARGSPLTNHCYKTRGSMIVLLRSLRPGKLVISSVFSSKPSSSKRSTTSFLAS